MDIKEILASRGFEDHLADELEKNFRLNWEKKTCSAFDFKIMFNQILLSLPLIFYH